MTMTIYLGIILSILIIFRNSCEGLGNQLLPKKSGSTTQANTAKQPQTTTSLHVRIITRLFSVTISLIEHSGRNGRVYAYILLLSLTIYGIWALRQLGT